MGSVLTTSITEFYDIRTERARLLSVFWSTWSIQCYTQGSVISNTEVVSLLLYSIDLPWTDCALIKLIERLTHTRPGHAGRFLRPLKWQHNFYWGLILWSKVPITITMLSQPIIWPNQFIRRWEGFVTKQKGKGGGLVDYSKAINRSHHIVHIKAYAACHVQYIQCSICLLMLVLARNWRGISQSFPYIFLSTIHRPQPQAPVKPNGEVNQSIS